MKFEFSFTRFLEGMYPNFKAALYFVAGIASVSEALRFLDQLFVFASLFFAASLCFHRAWVMWENQYAEA